MKHYSLNDMTKGWFVGDFSPTAYQSADVEVSVKTYTAGDREEKHHHKIATELTLILSGQVQMLDRTWNAGDIVVIEPGEATGFEALSNTVTVVVKLPSVAGDKYPG